MIHLTSTQFPNNIDVENRKLYEVQIPPLLMQKILHIFQISVRRIDVPLICTSTFTACSM
jgi:hypothetical protein